MTRIVLAGMGPDVEPAFAQATGGGYLSVPMPESELPSDLLGRIKSKAAPEVLVLDSRTDPGLSLGLAGRLSSEHPEIVIVFITDELEALSLRALRAGVSDLLPAEATIEEIQHSLQEAARRATALSAARHASTDPQVPTGRVVTVVSSKGGVGKTTVSTNLAVALARAMPNSTVIVDLDVQFGDVATALNLSPEHRLEDMVPSAVAGDTIALKARLTQHETGLYVLPAPHDPAAADGISSAQVSQLLQLLAQEFPFVVVDTSPGLSDHTLGALDQTTDPLLLTTLSVPGVSGMRKLVDTLSVLQMFNDRYHVVVNFSDARQGVSREDLHQTLGVPVRTAIPTSKAAPASVNVGIPLMQSRARDPLVKALKPLIKTLLPEDVSMEGSKKRRAGRKKEG